MAQPNAKLLAVEVERFKSFATTTRIDFAPLTVIHGRNNGGKSTLIQSLLLLKQTLEDPRSDVPLRLEGLVEAFNLRELTYGWPDRADSVKGPTIRLEWETEVYIPEALESARHPDLENLAKQTGIAWFRAMPERAVLRTSLLLITEEIRGNARISEIRLQQAGALPRAGFPGTAKFTLTANGDRWRCKWRRESADAIVAELDHFIPYLSINRSQVGPRDRQRAWHNAYVILFAQPLEALKSLLMNLQYLGSTRAAPPSLYKPSSTTPHEIGVSGEFAAQLLHRRQHDLVHYLPPIHVDDTAAHIPPMVRARPLVGAVNDVLTALGIDAPLTVAEVQEVGFRLLFGEASLVHVGRGLTYLLPMVELGLFADPLRFEGNEEDMTLVDYQAACGGFSHVAVEEPEAHLHPKVQTRLAHWLVSLALANRRLIVETHSDHLVRRLRGLAARAGRGSDLERWLLENVVIVGVEQDAEGRSHLTSSRLTAEGSVAEVWPADFMDEATGEESAIYYASLDKTNITREIDGEQPDPLTYIEGDEPDAEIEP